MKKYRFSIYMTEEDYHSLEELKKAVDPGNHHSRSKIISTMVKVLLAMFRQMPEDDNKWQEAVKQGKNTLG